MENAINLDMRPKQHLIADMEQYFCDYAAPCPYGFTCKAIYRQAPVDRLPDELFELFLANGFRRNGNYLYRMVCPACSKCIPIRLHPDDFSANRIQRRTVKRNRDIEITFEPIRVTDKKLALCSSFLASRFPDKDDRAEEYYSGFFLNSMITSMEVVYRLDKRIIGVAIIDLTENLCNAVYFYFDPEYASRSPGVFNIMTLLEMCRTREISYLYLGFWIAEVRAMKYKAAFTPHYLLQDQQWRRVM